MSRQEKIGAIILGVLLFAGLFHFIYTTMKTPLPTDLTGEDYANMPLDEGATDDTLDEEALPPEGETAAAAPEQKPAEAAAPAEKPAEAAAPAKK